MGLDNSGGVMEVWLKGIGWGSNCKGTGPKIPIEVKLPAVGGRDKSDPETGWYLARFWGRKYSGLVDIKECDQI